MPFRDRTDEAKQDKHYKHSSSRIERRWSKEGKLCMAWSRYWICDISQRMVFLWLVCMVVTALFQNAVGHTFIHTYSLTIEYLRTSACLPTRSRLA